MKRLISSLLSRPVTSVNIPYKQECKANGIKHCHAEAVDDVVQSFKDESKHDVGKGENCHIDYTCLMVNNYFCLLAFM